MTIQKLQGNPESPNFYWSAAGYYIYRKALSQFGKYSRRIFDPSGELICVDVGYEGEMELIVELGLNKVDTNEGNGNV